MHEINPWSTPLRHPVYYPGKIACRILESIFKTELLTLIDYDTKDHKISHWLSWSLTSELIPLSSNNSITSTTTSKDNSFYAIYLK